MLRISRSRATVGVLLLGMLQPILAVLIAALVLFAHRENIKRLLNGTENKFRFHVNAPKSEGEA